MRPVSRVDAAVAMASPWQSISGGITAPEGFLAAGVASGLKASGKPDLGLLLAPEAAVCAGTFTQSVVRAACVDLCAERLKGADGRARAVVVFGPPMPAPAIAAWWTVAGDPARGGSPGPRSR